jgi:hypothetical protein
MLMHMQHIANDCPYNVIHPFSVMKYTSNSRKMKDNKESGRACKDAL